MCCIFTVSGNTSLERTLNETDNVTEEVLTSTSQELADGPSTLTGNDNEQLVTVTSTREHTASNLQPGNKVTDYISICQLK